MKSKQVLSIEQMRHLQELGLDTSDASMYWVRRSHGSRIDDESKGEWFLSLQKEFMVCGFTSYEALPTYTLQDILDKLPPSIGNNTLTLQRHGDKWMCLYIEPYTRYSLHMEIKEKCIYAAYEMLCWAIKQEYSQLNKER